MVRIEQVTKVFHPREVNEVTAVDHVTLRVSPGEFVVIIGGNGSGKSTLMNLVAGSFLPDSGRIVIAGTDCTQMPEHARAAMLGRVFQDPLMGTAAGLTVEENFALAASRGEFRGLGPALNSTLRSEIRERLSLLEMGLEDRLRARVGLLSGGQRQAITILMAVFKQPRVLLLDEHTAALDPKVSQKIMALTRRIVSESGLTTLMVTHNLSHALDTADRLVMMNRGVVAQELGRDELRKMTVKDLLELFWVTQSRDDDGAPRSERAADQA
ncbi:MAG: ATP-binding cassette domain-containing protein [Thermodesulfobacteriota bacterium]